MFRITYSIAYYHWPMKKTHSYDVMDSIHGNSDSTRLFAVIDQENRNVCWFPRHQPSFLTYIDSICNKIIWICFQQPPPPKPHDSDDDENDPSEKAPLMGSTSSLSQNRKPEIISNVPKPETQEIKDDDKTVQPVKRRSKSLSSF